MGIERTAYRWASVSQHRLTRTFSKIWHQGLHAQEHRHKKSVWLSSLFPWWLPNWHLSSCHFRHEFSGSRPPNPAPCNSDWLGHGHSAANQSSFEMCREHWVFLLLFVMAEYSKHWVQQLPVVARENARTWRTRLTLHAPGVNGLWEYEAFRHHTFHVYMW